MSTYEKTNPGEIPTLTAAATAKKWGYTPALVTRLCRADRIPGAVYHERGWSIPAGTEKPPALRTGRKPLQKPCLEK